MSRKSNQNKHQSDKNNCEELSKKTDTELVKKIDKHVDEAIKRNFESTVKVVKEEIRATSIFSGPIPPPDSLQKYNEILPGSADRILKMAENQSSHRQDMEKIVIKSDARKSTLGSVFAFILGLISVTGGIFLIYNGYSAEGLGSIITPIAGLTGAFLYGTYKRNKERIEKQKEMRRIK